MSARWTPSGHRLETGAAAKLDCERAGCAAVARRPPSRPATGRIPPRARPLELPPSWLFREDLSGPCAIVTGGGCLLCRQGDLSPPPGRATRSRHPPSFRVFGPWAKRGSCGAWRLREIVQRRAGSPCPSARPLLCADVAPARGCPPATQWRFDLRCQTDCLAERESGVTVAGRAVTRAATAEAPSAPAGRHARAGGLRALCSSP